MALILVEKDLGSALFFALIGATFLFTLMGALIAGDTGARSPAAAVRDGHDAAPFKATMIHSASGPCRQ